MTVQRFGAVSRAKRGTREEKDKLKNSPKRCVGCRASMLRSEKWCHRCNRGPQ